MAFAAAVVVVAAAAEAGCTWEFADSGIANLGGSVGLGTGPVADATHEAAGVVVVADGMWAVFAPERKRRCKEGTGIRLAGSSLH